jgi:hypothetical protein
VARAEQKTFDSPDEVRELPHGRADVLRIGGGEVGRLTVEPGWRWSEQVRPVAGTDLCEAPHSQYVISGRIGGADDGRDGARDRPPGRQRVAAGPRRGVDGDEPAVAIDWGGAHVWATPAS